MPDRVTLTCVIVTVTSACVPVIARLESRPRLSRYLDVRSDASRPNLQRAKVKIVIVDHKMDSTALAKLYF